MVLAAWEEGSPAEVSTDASMVSCCTVIPNRKPGYRFIKRTFDIIASLLGLILLSPVFLIVSAAIFIDDPGPVLFFQERNGLNGKVFRMWKFRSMYKDAPEKRLEMEVYNEREGPAFKMKHDPRITRIGKLIRRMSIDELPQLVNVLLGQMSIVGPRPLPVYETAKLTEKQRQRLLVKPGLTCYWQIYGRKGVLFDEWMEYDYRYIQEQNLWVDCKIILATVPAILSGGGTERFIKIYSLYSWVLQINEAQGKFRRILQE